MVSLIGLVFIALAFWGVKRKGGDKTEALILTALIALDCMLVTYSRVGLIDGIMALFIFLAFFYGRHAEKKWEFALLGLFIGLAASVKWIALGVVAPLGFIAWRKKHLWSFIGALIVSGALYLGIETIARIVTNSQQIWADIREWNWQAWNYHKTLNATHPWSSQWWSWPLMLRPVLMYYQTNAQGLQETITNLGNPFLWYSSTTAVVLSLGHTLRLAFQRDKRSILLLVSAFCILGLLIDQILTRNLSAVLLALLALAGLIIYVLQTKDTLSDAKDVLSHPLVPLLIGYFAFYVPWMFIGRVVFIYHYLPSLLFATLMLAWWLRALYRKSPLAVIAFLIVALVFTLYYVPLNMGLPISKGFEQSHYWIKGWL